MEYKDRQALVKKLEELEVNYSVDEWRVNDDCIWPLLKRIIFFYSFKKGLKNSNKKSQIKNNLIRRFLGRVYKVVRARYLMLRVRSRKVDFVFSGAPSHRVVWSETQINRYFDPLIDFLEQKNKSGILLEYAPLNSEDVYRKDRVFDLTKVYPAFEVHPRRSVWSGLKKTPMFIHFLGEVMGAFGLDESTLKAEFETIYNKVQVWKDVYSYFFKKLKPEFCVGLCYYSSAMFGMNLAARRQGIRCVDMQHGTQGELHPMYSFKNVPKDGFDLLPDVFWCWDKYSSEYINSWNSNGVHSAEPFGNPWGEFLKSNVDKDFEVAPKHKTVILLTLQPLTPIIDNNIALLIKETQFSYSWWIRFHPRMKPEEKKEFLNTLKENGIEIGNINLNEANQYPLQSILTFTDFHISRYSGCIIEAAQAGVISLIVDKIGTTNFSQLILNGLAFDCTNDMFEDCMRYIEEGDSRKRSHEYLLDYTESIKTYLEK